VKSRDPSPPPAVYSIEQEDFTYVALNVPCQAACPASTNIPAYIRAFFEKQHSRSYGVNRGANVLPGVLGRICSRPCENRCRHGEPELGLPVAICHIKRAAADLKEDLPRERGGGENPPASLGKRVAIVGSGPAGLAAAHDLALAGVSVTIFEALDEAGGMLRYGIPEFRLPRRVLDEEIDYIAGLGTVIRTGMRLGDDLSMENLLGEHDALLLATGCYQPKRLEVPGEDLPGVYTGLGFMMQVNRGASPDLGERVLVIGDGFTAFDCARSSLRLGAGDVRICMLRTEEDLAVTKDEIREAGLEGVRFESLVLARKIAGEGRVEGVEFVRTLLGDTGPDGLRKISPIEGSEALLPADTVIVAIGQSPGPLDLPGGKGGKGPPVADRETFRASARGLYAAGDYLTGASTVIEAIAMGRRAAARIVEDLAGRRLSEKAVRMEDTRVTDRERFWDYLPRQEMPSVVPVAERLKNPPPEVETGFSPESAAEESKRCYLCYLHYEIDVSRCIYCRYCIDVAPRDCIKLVKKVQVDETGAVSALVEAKKWKEVHAVVIDNARCIRCGACVRVCPVDCISVTKVELVERAREGEGDRG
jgi:formate dehydrogenase major subunit